MAELWKLPVVYVIENNRYAMGTSVTRSSAQTDFSRRGTSLNIPGVQIDGMDVRAVKAAGDKAVAWFSAGNGPFHPGNADLPLPRPFDVGPGGCGPARRSTRYGTITIRSSRYATGLLAAKMSEQDLKAIDAEVREIVKRRGFRAARAQARRSNELYTDVYR